MKRVLSLLLVCLIVLSPTAVFAQSDSTMPVICGDLDEETCDLLHQSQAAMKEVASSVQNTEFQLSMQNAPEFPVKDASVDLNVAQVTYIDTEYMKEVEEMMLGASEAMADDMEGFMEDYMAAIAGVYSHLSLDMEMDIELSEEIAQFASDLDAATRAKEKGVHMCFGNYGGQSIQRGTWQNLIGFINRIRRKERVAFPFVVDELKDLSVGNATALLNLLARNNITMVSAFPDVDPDLAPLFNKNYKILPGRTLATVKLENEEAVHA